jgi:hypothetical protein
MPPTAQEAFYAWLFKVASLGGSVLLLALLAAIVVVAMTSRKREE